MKPKVIINFKTYKTGRQVLKMSKQIQKIDRDIIVGVQAADIREISRNTRLVVYAQHVDAVLPGRNTGFITAEGVRAQGAKGTFLNHSEHKLDMRTIRKTIEICKRIRLKTAVFAKDIGEARQIEKLSPDLLIYEPPELVAGKKSVSTENPEIVKSICKKIKMPILVGAGIKSSEDVRTAIRLGAKGIAVSSAITKAKHPDRVLRELVS